MCNCENNALADEKAMTDREMHSKINSNKNRIVVAFIVIKLIPIDANHHHTPFDSSCQPSSPPPPSPLTLFLAPLLSPFLQRHLGFLLLRECRAPSHITTSSNKIDQKNRKQKRGKKKPDDDDDEEEAGDKNIRNENICMCPSAKDTYQNDLW